MSSRRLDLTDAAEQDIRGILRSTRSRWGDRRANAYERQLTDALEQLLRYPQLGRRADHFASDLRVHTVGQHVVFYRAIDRVVTVVRLLHVRMDAVSEFVGETS